MSEYDDKDAGSLGKTPAENGFRILSVVRAESETEEPGPIQEIHYTDKTGDVIRMYLDPSAGEK